MQKDLLSNLNFEGIEPKEYRFRHSYLSSALPDFSETYRGGSLKSPSTFGSLSATRSARKSAIDDSRMPSQVKLLEKLLQQTFGNEDIEITNIKSLYNGRKQEVKEVFYDSEGAIYKVWVFKADPAQTIRELKIYHIAHQAGVQTGKPLGFKPKPQDTEYPYDIAVLGGVLQHAGDSYQQLLSSMAISPRRMHGAALGVAQMIADYHVKLTNVKELFDQYGIELKPFNVREEAKARLLAGLKITDENSNVKALLNALEKINGKAKGPLLVSHNDIHDRQIVTLSKVNKGGAIGYQHSMFGVIDWDSIGLDTPHGDLWDFWVHHRRLVNQIAYNESEYTFGFDTLEEAYNGKFLEGTDKYELPVNHAESSNAKRVVWNLLEMYDPSRKTDAQVKAVRHARHLAIALKEMGSTEADTVKRSLLRILNDEVVKLALKNE